MNSTDVRTIARAMPAQSNSGTTLSAATIANPPGELVDLAAL
jgi:hypothetical protein